MGNCQLYSLLKSDESLNLVLVASPRSDPQGRIVVNGYDFFIFYRSLKAYQNSFNTKQDLLVLDLSSSFFEFFKHSLLRENGTLKKN